MVRKSHGKRLILINRDLQFRYARIALVIGVVSTLLSCVVILYPLYAFEYIRTTWFLPRPILSGMVLAMVINLAFVLYLAIIITHRIAGPMFALSREFAEISQGVFGRELTVRQHDDLKYLIRSFNDMSQCLKYLTYDDLERLHHLQELVRSCQEGLPKDGEGAGAESADSIRMQKTLQEMSALLTEFHHEVSQRSVTPKGPSS